MPVCQTCNRSFRTEAACVQHCKDKAHTYVAPVRAATSTVAAASKPAPTPAAVATPKATPAFECKPCCLVFTDKAQYEEHQRIKHAPLPKFNCEPCAMNFSSPEALSVHLRNFAVHPKCGQCGSAFINQQELDRHVELAHPSKFKCAPCGRQVAIADRQKHFRESPNHPSCFVCEEGFLDDSELEKHLSGAHFEFRCSMCRRQLRSAEELQQHYLTSPIHPHCALCEIGFLDDIACDKHMQINHPRPPPKVPSPPPSPAPPTVSEPPSSLDTQRSTQSSPLVQRPALSIVHPAVSAVLNEKSELDDNSYETVEASSHVQRAVSEPTLPTASSIGDGLAGTGNVQGTPFYASRSPTISERSFEDMARAGRFSGRYDSESTLSLRSATSSPSRSSIRTPSPQMPPAASTAPRLSRPATPDNRPASVLSQRASIPPPVSPQPRPASSTLSERIFQHASRTPSRAVDTPVARSVAASSASRPPTPAAARTPLLSVVSRPLSRVSALSASSRPAVSPSQKPSVTAVEPASLSDSEGTVEAAPVVPKLKTAVRPQGKTGAISWHCRSCMQDPCVAPTATMCGHVFCSACIIQELSKTGACPACGKLILLRLHVEAD
ncbi:hypothetical protein OH77DRAFT_1392612 [Trametes cingulata]|nr:hypothetical protein OH77DRAFT_1392612 [Trametes cingulata]